MAITQADLHQLFIYEPETGVFRWKETGEVAGSPRDERGYIRININSKHRYYAHRLAFIYMTGECPQYVDHIDGDKANTRWGNLRQATKSQNGMNRGKSKNNKSGVKGVSYQHNAYVAEIWVNGEKHYLGRFPSVDLAAAMVSDARVRLHGEFARQV